MMQPRFFLALLTHLIFYHPLYSQNYFQKICDTDLFGEACGIEVLSNGDILTAGAVSITDPFLAQFMWIQHLNPQGNLIWSKTYSGTGSTKAVDIQRTPSGDGYWVIFNTQLQGLAQSGWMKISESGDVLFSRTGTFASAVYKKIILLSDGNYLICGDELTNGFSGGFLLKINASGNVLWKIGLDDFGNDGFEDCWEDAEGLIYCCGYSRNFDGNRDGMLAKFSPTGTLLWSRRYGSGASDQFTGVAPFSSDSSLLLAGYSAGFGGETHIWLSKISTLGVLKWSRSYAIQGQNLSATDLQQVPGNQFLVSVADPFSLIGSPAMLFKISADGNLLWEYEYKTGGEGAVVREVIPAAAGFLAAGSTANSGDESLYVLKIAGDGLIPGSDCCPVPAGLTVKEVFPETENFVAGTNGVFENDPFTMLTDDVPSQVINVCSFIDLSFTVSDSSICPGECVEITLTGNTPGVDYSLLTPGGVPDPGNPLRVCYPDAGNYFITRKGDNGVCSKEQSVRLETGNRADAFPNAFTPNGDGVNDTFKPIFLCPVASTHFRIFNRWGQKVFESRDPNAAWDGKIAGAEAASDVYGWQVEYEVLRDGVAQKRTAQGDVTLLR